MSEHVGSGLELCSLKRSFAQGESVLRVLDGIDLSVKRGEIVALVGPSGSGKSTLLQVAGLLERPDEGCVRLDGRDVTDLSDSMRTQLRRHAIGFVYQNHCLLPEFSALENVMMPQYIARCASLVARDRALSLLHKVGLSARADHRSGQLSGGEQQRVALCRALANQPAVLLADEPTGNLDPAASDMVFSELLCRVREDGVAALVATHNMALAARMDRVVSLQGGVIVHSPVSKSERVL